MALAEGGSSLAPKRGNEFGARNTWSHCVSIGGKARNVKCKYCEKVLTCGIY